MFAIRVKGTDQFLPNAQGRRGRGFTHVEPTADDAPRLFHRRQDAVVALGWWLKGIVTVSQVPCQSSYESFGYDDYDEDWSTAPVEGRRITNMEIVEIELVVREPTT